MSLLKPSLLASVLPESGVCSRQQCWLPTALTQGRVRHQWFMSYFSTLPLFQISTVLATKLTLNKFQLES